MSAVAGNEASPHRLLLIAYRLDPDFSMESRLAWRRALAAAQHYRVTVLCALCGVSPETIRTAGIDVLHVPPAGLEIALGRRPVTFSLAYQRWRRRAYRAARRRHRQTPFGLVHHVSYCGYRQPSLCWRLGAPYIWGPLGGTHAFPARFLRAIEPLGAARELARNAINAFQLRWSPAVRAAMRRSSAVLAASEQAARELTAAGYAIDDVMLETGVDSIALAPRQPREPSAPLRILWAGRACSWKALPLLLRALAEISSDCSYELRVMSAGALLGRWQREAARLGISDRIQWVGWPGCAGRQPHYSWADVFAFTSLRDTSGTGLLESLAAGTPIVGLDHQGAADVMTERCALKIPVDNPRGVVNGFRAAIERLAADRQLAARLSEGARERAASYLWASQSERLLAVYEKALRAPSTPAAARSAQPDQSTESAPCSPRVAANGACTVATPQRQWELL